MGSSEVQINSLSQYATLLNVIYLSISSPQLCYLEIDNKYSKTNRALFNSEGTRGAIAQVPVL